MALDEGVAHLLGDYVAQSDWMAQEKTTSALPAAAHAVTYAVWFVPLTRSWRALAVIGGTHYLIDRHRLARYVVWAKNQAAPARHRYPLSHAGWHGYHGEHRPVWTETDPTYGRIDPDIQARVEEMAPQTLGSRVAMENTLQARRGPQRVNQAPTGDCVSDGKPEWLAGWLLIIADNALHLAINGWALRRWGRR